MAQLKDKYRQIQITFLSIFIIGVIIIEATAQVGFIWLLALGAFTIALSLAILTSMELLALDVESNGQAATSPNSSEFIPAVPLTFTFVGVYGVILTPIGDKTHYMNRDENTWAYIGIAISCALVLGACFLSMKWIKDGCGCCARCCCQGCRPCCQSQEEGEGDE